MDGTPRCVCKYASYTQVVTELSPLLFESGLNPDEVGESISRALIAREREEVRKLALAQGRR